MDLFGTYSMSRRNHLCLRTPTVISWEAQKAWKCTALVIYDLKSSYLCNSVEGLMGTRTDLPAKYNWDGREEGWWPTMRRTSGSQNNSFCAFGSISSGKERLWVDNAEPYFRWSSRHFNRISLQPRAKRWPQLKALSLALYYETRVRVTICVYEFTLKINLHLIALQCFRHLDLLRWAGVERHFIAIDPRFLNQSMLMEAVVGNEQHCWQICRNHAKNRGLFWRYVGI